MHASTHRYMTQGLGVWVDQAVGQNMSPQPAVCNLLDQRVATGIVAMHAVLCCLPASLRPAFTHTQRVESNAHYSWNYRV
jgi:hypothetical protein